MYVSIGWAGVRLHCIRTGASMLYIDYLLIQANSVMASYRDCDL